MSLNKDAIKLLDRLYKDLYLNSQVLHHGSGNKYDKFNNIESYLNKLEDTHDKIFTSNKHIEYLKKCYYEKYVIKIEDIPENYYTNQEQMALDRGFGHIKITEDQKIELQNEVIENQKKSLDTWIDYFLCDDSKVYPFWAKYWAFQGMLSLGYFDKEKNKFYKRNKNTVYPFCDLNREALSMSIDLLIKNLNKKEIDDKDLEILVKSGSFQKIYTYILTKVLHDNKNITKRNIGKWVKYDQGSDHMIIVNSLKGYNTGWCTAGESTAKTQLQTGDFYVYYTLDDNDEYKIPRIAIRMEGFLIGEIRGIAKDQNIEPDMEKVVEEKIKDFPDKDLYYKKVNDMKFLTDIYKKFQDDVEPTKEELIFLYELNGKIDGFGYKEDPRIKEILEYRNKRKDLAYVLDCEEKQIAFDEDELKNSDNILYYDRTVSFIDLKDAKGVKFPKYVRCSVFLNGLKSAKGLVLPEYIGAHLSFDNLESIEDLVLSKYIGGSLSLDALKNAKGFVFPEYINGYLYLGSLEDADGVIFPKYIAESLSLRKLKDVKTLKMPEYIGINLGLEGLINAQELILPKYVGGNLILNVLENVDILIFSEYVGGNIHLGNLEKSKDLVFPKFVGKDLFLNNMKIAQNTNLPEYVGGMLILISLETAENLVLPKKVDGDVYLTNLESTEGLIFPNNLTYNIFMKGFVITPDNVDQYRNKQKTL